MNAPHTAMLVERPTAATETVERLVAKARRGQIRIPTFQRGLKWTSDDVLALFDSIYKGYPIGSLLLRKGPAEPNPDLQLGPLSINAPALQDAWWVVDGQQRLTALTAGLAHPTPLPTTATDPYVVYFDVDREVFVAPPGRRATDLPPTWVPVAQLLDAAALSEWVYEWEHSRDEARRRRVFEVGKRLREYEVPLYIVDLLGDESKEEILKEIFLRTNKSGRAMAWPDVHNALFPNRLSSAEEELELEGMGRLDERQLLLCLLAYEGLDPTRNLAVHFQRGEKERLRNTAQTALPTLRRALRFLREEAEIPHMRLLPLLPPFLVLVRYFRLYPAPSARAQRLLVRFIWRTLLSTKLLDIRVLQRQGVPALVSPPLMTDEEAAQEMLSQVPKSLPQELAYQLPKRFDARAAESRLLLLGLASLQPQEDDGRPLDIAALIQRTAHATDQGAAAFRSIYPGKSLPANQIFWSAEVTGVGIRRQLLTLPPLMRAPILASHGISEPAFEALERANATDFLSLRATFLLAHTRQMGARLAEWGASDRVSIDNLMASAPPTL